MKVPLILVGAFLLSAVLPTSALLPNITIPSDFTNLTFRLVSQDPNVVGNYSVLNHTTNISAPWTVVAEVVYNESYDALGWDFIQVTANPTLLAADDQGYRAYYAAGYLEGYVSADRIGQVFVGNNLTSPQPPAVMAWVEEHVAFMTKRVLTGNSPFWTQLGNLFAQMEGIAAGYTASITDRKLPFSGNRPPLAFIDIFLLNFNNELGDIYNVVNASSSFSSTQKAPRQRTAVSAVDDGSMRLLPFNNGNLHCSALVKVTSDDIFFSHVTWGGYNTMLRQYKIYRFQTTVSLSSVAGTIASGDDWYTTNNMLSIQETTNDYYNMALLEYVIPQSTSEFLRVMIATFLANSGQEWVELFQFNNSGTYCNQWMILDYKLYTPGMVGDALPDQLLWVAEQIPGNVTSADVSFVLRNTSYWASFNIPYFPNIYNISGFEQMYLEFGPVNSYTEYARPQIFKRNETMVKDLVSMRAMMRYNDWEKDPLSIIPLCPECSPRGSPWLVIASRGDLAPTYNPGPANPEYAGQFQRAPMGAIDAKIASFSMMMNNGMGNVICGPTSDQQPIFNFDEAFPGNRPPGSANVFDFPWTFFNVVGSFARPGVTAAAGNNDTRDVIIGVCIGVPVALLAVSYVVYRYHKSSEEDSQYVPVNQA